MPSEATVMATKRTKADKWQRQEQKLEHKAEQRPEQEPINKNPTERKVSRQAA
jgi:hypothetical protein